MTKRRNPSLAVGLAAVLALAASAAERPATTTSPATPEPGTDIPQVTVKFGMRPYADNTFYVIGIEKGWFKDVGITIEPAPYGLKTTENQWVSILLNEQVDINTATCSIMLPSYKTTDQLKCAGFAVTFFGSVMLANPKLGLKTVRDYAKGGATFEEALRSALEPLVGQTVYVPAAVSEKEFNEVPFKLAGLDLPAYVTMDDAQMLLLAKSGRLDFMHPGGAPIAQTLLDAGWTPVYDTGQLLEFGPGGVNSPLEVAGVQQRLGLDRRLHQQQPDDDDALCLRGVPHFRRAEGRSIPLRRLRAVSEQCGRNLIGRGRGAAHG